MDRGWGEFLRAPEESAHAVQIYEQIDELAESVAAYLATGFAEGEPAVVIATREHEAVFMRALAGTGWDADLATDEGLLTRFDAEEAVGKLFDGKRISRRTFETLVAGAIDDAAERFPGKRVRAFGEMVDVLTDRGEHAAAARLERLWNELSESRHFALLCGYRLDVFDRTAQAGVLPAVCAAHTLVRPAYDSARLDRAVYDALDEVLGSSSARMVHGIVGDDAGDRATPLAEQMLIWISERMPRHADRVLAVARENYARTADRVS